MPKIIQVSNLSKCYTITHEGRESYTALRDVVAKKAKKIFTFSKSAETTKEAFWALKDINFDIEQGERVGIIGRNGAGKSTLLKILSRITEPTGGNIKIKGRVASLLEVGTGFHPELSGRENIFLNGAILGMNRAEIKRHFDAIVDFAEVEQFLDTPVKRYSSGMYVRLAFAVAAHLEPEILVVDEVLAVGDAQFQKKCLGKMEDVSKHGRTVLFVSHNMGSIRTLCNKGILLREGRVDFIGPVQETIDSYSKNLLRKDNNTAYKSIAGNGDIKIDKVSINDGLKVHSVFANIDINIKYTVFNPKKEFHFFVLIHNSEGDVICSIFQKDKFLELSQNNKEINIVFENILTPGLYYISAGIYGSNHEFLDWVDKVEEIEVDHSFDDGKAFDQRYGIVTANSKWYV
ncbi:MAG: ABC transporter ATP-binding protein [Ferruginibacter sp.]